jgi:hypothetical protein
MKAQVATTVSPESGMLLKTISPALGVRLGATLGATRMNNLRMIRTRLDNRERQARGHEPI